MKIQIDSVKEVVRIRMCRIYTFALFREDRTHMGYLNGKRGGVENSFHNSRKKRKFHILIKILT